MKRAGIVKTTWISPLARRITLAVFFALAVSAHGQSLKADNSGGETKTERLNGVGSPRPNIVYFFLDDMGWQDTSVPFHTEVTPLNQRYRTPNMERLAAQGMKFTQAYACAVCSPSRVSLMTGLNAARHGVTNWTLRKDRSPDRNHPIIQPSQRGGLYIYIYIHTYVCMYTLRVSMYMAAPLRDVRKSCRGRRRVPWPR